MSRQNFTGTPLTRYLFGDENAKEISIRKIDGQIWYVAQVICGLVGISNPSQAVNGERADRKQLNDDERRKESIHTGNHGKDHVLMVNNVGMLRLIYQSRKPAALIVQERIDNIPERLFPPEWGELYS